MQKKKRKDDLPEDAVVDPDPTTQGIDVEKPPIDPLTDLFEDPYVDATNDKPGSNEGGIVPENEAWNENSEGLPAGTPGHGGTDEGTD